MTYDIHTRREECGHKLVSWEARAHQRRKAQPAFQKTLHQQHGEEEVEELHSLV